MGSGVQAGRAHVGVVGAGEALWLPVQGRHQNERDSVQVPSTRLPLAGCHVVAAIRRDFHSVICYFHSVIYVSKK